MSTTVRSQPLCVRQRVTNRQQWHLAELLAEDRWTQLFAAHPAGTESGEDFVVKLSRQGLSTEYDRQLARGLLQREATVSRHVQHRHLTATLDIVAGEGGIGLVQPRLRGTPFSVVDSFPIGQKLWIVRQIAHALSALHAAGWLHGEGVSEEAIFVMSNGQATLGQLGWCRQLATDECDVARTSFFGDVRFAAPEMFEDAGMLTAAADVYSLGLLLVKLLTAKSPFAQYEGPEIIAAKRLLPASEIVLANLPFALRSLSARMLSRDPLRRPTVGEVIQTLIAAEIAEFA